MNSRILNRCHCRTDFGFARNHSRGTNFVSTESWGTPEYLSPERTVGDAHDERLSDLWALGVWVAHSGLCYTTN